MYIINESWVCDLVLDFYIIDWGFCQAPKNEKRVCGPIKVPRLTKHDKPKPWIKNGKPKNG